MYNSELQKIHDRMLENHDCESISQLIKLCRTKAKQRKHAKNPNKYLQPWQRQQRAMEKSKKRG
jgi:hypothetical protein